MDLDDLKGRLQGALQSFRDSAPAADVAHLEGLIDQAHAQASRLLDGTSTASIDNRELARIKGLLDPQQRLGPIDLHDISVSDGGELVGDAKYETLDVGWVEAAVQWLRFRNNRASFPPISKVAPPVVSIPDNASLAIVGDWGTGTRWRTDGLPTPAAKVASAVAAKQPDITIHLGDVYYAGSPTESQSNFVADWPLGSSGSFALNSNHEMYYGAWGYKQVTLRSASFIRQQGSRCFLLRNSNWLIVGLDSAYASDWSTLYQNGRFDDDQLVFLTRVATTAGTRSIILLTHHNGLSLDGTTTQPLWDQALKALGGQPAHWYWGHAHAAASYRARDGIVSRCCGHGAIPAGVPSALEGKPGCNWYEKRLAGDSGYPSRVLNGFALVTLRQRAIDEVFIDENGGVTALPVAAS